MTTAADYLTFDVQQIVTDYKLRTRSVPSQEVTVTNTTDVFIITVLIEDTFAASNISPNQLILGPRESKTFRITYDVGVMETLPVGSIPATISVTATAEPIEVPPPAPPPPPPPPIPPPPVVVRGCTDVAAFNYSPIANVDDGSCVAKIYGCTNVNALNYSPLANIDSGQCEFPVTPVKILVRGCTNRTALNYDPIAEQDDGTCIPVIVGCRDPNALNYNSNANRDGEQCLYKPPIEGCTDFNANNYNPLATVPKNDTCEYGAKEGPVTGCMDRTMKNWNPLATQPAVPDICEPFPVRGCTDPTACNWNPLATEPNGTCEYRTPCVEKPGCTNPDALNHNPNANVDDGSCEFDDICGCTDPLANNYIPEATKRCGDACTYDIPGCTNRNAFNWKEDANVDDGSCVFVACTNPNARNHVQGPNIIGCVNDVCCEFRCGDPVVDNNVGICSTIGSIASVGPKDANGYARVCRYIQRFNADGCYTGCGESCTTEFIGKPEVLGCMDRTAENYNPDATKDNPNEPCRPFKGCTDPLAKNRNPKATVDDGSCQYWKIGCMDKNAFNYDGEAEINLQALCIPRVYGCTDRNALNTNPKATDDDGSCVYRKEDKKDGGGTGLCGECFADSDCFLTAEGTYNPRRICDTNTFCCAGGEVLAS